MYKKGYKRDCNIYRAISLLSTTYKILFNILLPKFSSYVEEINDDHACGFQNNRSTNDYILHSSYTWERMGTQWGSASSIHRLQESLRFI